MAANIQTPQAATRFRVYKQPDIVATQEEQITTDYRDTLNTRLTRDFSSMADLYEKKQLSDTDFATRVETMVNAVPDKMVRDEWQPKVTDTKYQVLRNSQDLQDAKITLGLTNGTMDSNTAADLYNQMANASITQNTRSSSLDALSWQLKATSIKASQRSSGGSGGGRRSSSSSSTLTKTQMGYMQDFEDKIYKLEEFKSQQEADLIQARQAYANGQITKEQLDQASTNAANSYGTMVKDFADSGAFKNYTFDVDAESSLYYLNEQINGLRAKGAESFAVNPTYQEYMGQLNESTWQPESQPVEQPTKETVYDTSAGAGQGGGTFGAGEEAQPVTPVSQEANRRQNPLNAISSFIGKFF